MNYNSPHATAGRAQVVRWRDPTRRSFFLVHVILDSSYMWNLESLESSQCCNQAFSICFIKKRNQMHSLGPVITVYAWQREVQASTTQEHMLEFLHSNNDDTSSDFSFFERNDTSSDRWQVSGSLHQSLLLHKGHTTSLLILSKKSERRAMCKVESFSFSNEPWHP